MAKFITDTMIAMKLVWLRVLLYFLIPFLTVLTAQTETWSGATFEETHWFLKFRIVIIAAMAGLGSIGAFIDQSLARARDQLKPNETKETKP